MVQIRVKSEVDTDDSDSAPIDNRAAQESSESASSALECMKSFLHLLMGIYAFLEHLCTGLGVLISFIRSEDRSLER